MLNIQMEPIGYYQLTFIWKYCCSSWGSRCHWYCIHWKIRKVINFVNIKNENTLAETVYPLYPILVVSFSWDLQLILLHRKFCGVGTDIIEESWLKKNKGNIFYNFSIISQMCAKMIIIKIVDCHFGKSCVNFISAKEWMCNIFSPSVSMVPCFDQILGAQLRCVKMHCLFTAFFRFLGIGCIWRSCKDEWGIAKLLLGYWQTNFCIEKIFLFKQNCNPIKLPMLKLVP